MKIEFREKSRIFKTSYRPQFSLDFNETSRKMTAPILRTRWWRKKKRFAPEVQKSWSLLEKKLLQAFIEYLDILINDFVCTDLKVWISSDEYFK